MKWNLILMTATAFVGSTLTSEKAPLNQPMPVEKAAATSAAGMRLLDVRTR